MLNRITFPERAVSFDRGLPRRSHQNAIRI